MKITGIILAGGKSVRMGEDKGLMAFEGKAMIEYVIEVVVSFVDEIIIISNNSEYEQFGYPVYEDLIRDKGPLAGVYTGLTYSNTSKNIVLSCDVPFLSESLINLLLENSGSEDVLYTEKNGRSHPLIGIYDRNCISFFKQQIDNNQLKMQFAVERTNYRQLDANNIGAKAFKNINYRDDIEA